MKIKTEPLTPGPIEIEVDMSSMTLADLKDAIAARLRLEPTAHHLRLEGFTEDWESLFHRGRRLDLTSTEPLRNVLGDASVRLPVAYVRRCLRAEGWKLKDKGDSQLGLDSDEEEADEMLAERLGAMSMSA